MRARRRSDLPNNACCISVFLCARHQDYSWSAESAGVTSAKGQAQCGGSGGGGAKAPLDMCLSRLDAGSRSDGSALRRSRWYAAVPMLGRARPGPIAAARKVMFPYVRNSLELLPWLIIVTSACGMPLPNHRCLTRGRYSLDHLFTRVYTEYSSLDGATFASTGSGAARNRGPRNGSYSRSSTALAGLGDCELQGTGI